MAIQLVLIWNFWNHVDIHIVDEVNYYYRGYMFLRGELSALSLAWGPLYCVAYGLLDLLPLGDVLPLDVMNVVVVMGSPLALWWFLRAVYPAPLPVLAAAWWGASPLLLNSGEVMALQYVYVCGLSLLALSAGFLVRGRPRLCAAALVAACLVRIEYSAVLIVAGGLLLVFGRRWSRASVIRTGWLLVLPGLALAAIAVVHRGIGERSWLAFRQHRALVAWRLAGAPKTAVGAHPFGAPDRWIQRDFPTATSIGEAVRENPAAFLGHVRHNIDELPAALGQLFLQGHAHFQGLRLAALICAVVLLLAGVISCRGQLRRLFPTRRLEPWLLLGGGAVTAPIALMFKCRAELMLPLLLLGTCAAANLVLAGSRLLKLQQIPGARWLRVGLPMLVLTAAAAGPAVFPASGNKRLAHRTSARIVQQHLPDDRAYRVLGTQAGSYLKLSAKTKRHMFSTPGRGQRSMTFKRLLVQARPDFVLVNPDLTAFQSVYPRMWEALRSPRWRWKEIHPGYHWLTRIGD